jgi:tRNA (guanine37-N1)-methyltransferase
VGSVAMEDKVEGEFRIRSLKHLAGERNIETTHRENGLQYLLDPAKVYFSPRLATERMRVAMAVQERFATDNVRETVLDLFAGVGPFALLLGKKAPVETVVAVDKNPVAVDYLKVNISLNKLGNVEAVCGDAALYPKELGARGKRFHRIIMNFPSHPDPFFAPALDAAGPGALIHFYRITGHGELDTVKEFLERTATGAGRGIKDIVHRHIRTYSATLSHYAFDVRLE